MPAAGGTEPQAECFVQALLMMQGRVRTRAFPCTSCLWLASHFCLFPLGLFHQPLAKPLILSPGWEETGWGWFKGALLKKWVWEYNRAFFHYKVGSPIQGSANGAGRQDTRLRALAVSSQALEGILP